jgi:glycerophosphoryl diester phosphodiesterase
MRTQDPLVIAHRGASGYRPEHTLAGYELAIRMGADFVEPDLVSTRDGVLIARHENEIGRTTDVATHPEFAGRHATRVVDGQERTGWFSEDFTLAEVKTLRAVERMPLLRPGNTAFDGRFEVATLEELLYLAEREGRRRGTTVGVAAEIKHPTHFASLGLSMTEPLVATLRRHHLDRPNAPVILQSFETGVVRELSQLVRVPLVQLVDGSGAPYDLVARGDRRTYHDLLTPAGLREISTYADGIGAAKEQVLPRGPAQAPGPLVADAHAAGLEVHVWTLRAENRFLATDLQVGPDPDAPGDLGAEVRAFLDAGVDGLITDHTDHAVAARRQWLGAGVPVGR